MARKTDYSESGQLILPALFVLPIFFLILIFVIEIGNLSRDKIRTQFALDAAATLEMEQYTDLLNRLSYLNGVFPNRIFHEVYGNAFGEYWNTGLYPGGPRQLSYASQTWPIRYRGARAYANIADPPADFGILHMHLPGSGAVTLEHANQVAFSYISIYQWMGDVATAQKLVFENTTMNSHPLLRKSMWMNLKDEGTTYTCKGGMESCGAEAADAFPDMSIRMHYLQGFKHCPVIVSIAGQTYSGELAGAFNFAGNGLWQLATIPQAQLDNLEKGYVVKHHWQPRGNYFHVDFVEDMNPFVRAKVYSSGGRIWPDTTPKYITRLMP